MIFIEGFLAGAPHSVSPTKKIRTVCFDLVSEAY